VIPKQIKKSLNFSYNGLDLTRVDNTTIENTRQYHQDMEIHDQIITSVQC